MKNRVVLWSIAGFLISLSWFIFAVTRSAPMTLGDPTLWSLAKITQPVILTGMPLKFYWVFAANATTYGLVGLMVESARHRLGQTH